MTFHFFSWCWFILFGFFYIQQNFVSLFWGFIYKIDGFQFEHVSSLNKKHGISFFVIMWIDFAWILVLYLLGKALNRFNLLFWSIRPNVWLSFHGVQSSFILDFKTTMFFHQIYIDYVWYMIKEWLEHEWLWQFWTTIGGNMSLCFGGNMFWCIFISVKYVSSISNILDTLYISNVLDISYVSREYYVLGCYKLNVINMML